MLYLELNGYLIPLHWGTGPFKPARRGMVQAGTDSTGVRG